MDLTEPDRTAICYIRWKAVLFGGMMLALAGLMIWVGIDAFDPAWTATVTDGEWLVAAPYWIRAPFILVIALFVGVPGLWMLWAAASGAPVVIADQVTITARTIFGRRRSLCWAAIVDAKRKQNQIILAPEGTNGLIHEIWDRRSVHLDTGMLEGDRFALEALVHRYRPDLVFRDVA
jgi:hypothetical protein